MLRHWATEGAGSAVLDGQIHVIGGSNFGTNDDHRTYDPLTGTWGRRMRLPEKLGQAPAVEVNGKIYVFGRDAAWEYSPERELP